MEQELWKFFMDSFCEHLRKIRGEMEENGGDFVSTEMLDDTVDCIRGIKDLHRVKAMADAK